MMQYLWPIKTGVTFFDYWTIAHLAFWWVVGSSLAALDKRGFVWLCACLGGAFVWETFEQGAHRWWPGVWQNPESWVNSWLSDPLMCIIAVLLAWWGYDRWRP